MATPGTQHQQQQTPSRVNAKRFAMIGGATGVVFGVVLGNDIIGTVQLGALTGGLCAIGGAVWGSSLHALVEKILGRMPVDKKKVEDTSLPECVSEPEVRNEQPAGLSYADPREPVAAQAQDEMQIIAGGQHREPHVPASTQNGLPLEWVSPNAAGKRPTHDISAMRH